MTTDPLVLVSARALDDLLELARRVAERGDPTDPLVGALRGATAQLRTESLIEPTPEP